MILSRREIIGLGGGALVALALSAPRAAMADDVVDIAMQGRGDGSKVWFDPIGVLIKPGQTVRWTNRNPGNSHTATAYSPTNFDRPLRMPAGAKAWHSDFLLPGENFSVTLTVEGVYDYYCLPHEHAGMVGRIIVGSPGEHDYTADAGGLPEVALKAFPTVEDILEAGTVHPA